jgi:PKD repeat protein
MKTYSHIKLIASVLCFAILLIVAGCNLTGVSEQPVETSQQQLVTASPLPTRTVISAFLPTQIVSSLAAPTLSSLVLPPTSQLPNNIIVTQTNTPISIVILSPIPGNVVAGNVQVLGAVIHPQFLQYQLEYGPDPNPSNLWYPASGNVQSPVLNGLLGIWGTTGTPDGTYQLRLRLTLRDGTNLATVVNNIRVQNQAPTPVPTTTPNLPRPIAAFTQDRTIGQSPLAIRFVNLSSGNITSFNWSFGDGLSSRDANPTHTFQNSGLYNVTLTVVGPGGSSNVSQQINVQAATAPTAGFNVSSELGIAPLTVNFQNTTTGNVSSYQWDFGDGTTNTDISPTHTYINPGTYNVILTAVGTGGSSTATRQITVNEPTPQPPVARFSTDRLTGEAPLTVQFLNDSTGAITSYEWSFGDGGASSDTNPTYTYQIPGTFTANLTVRGAGGESSSQVQIQVSQSVQLPPTAAFVPSTTTGNIPLGITFQNTSSGEFEQVLWDFGDGTTSSETSPQHTFSVAGNYNVVLTVIGRGGSSTAQTIISVAPVEVPVASFSTNPSTGIAPLTVSFDSISSSGEINTYSWDFGDGTGRSEDPNPIYVYPSEGQYTISLVVYGPGGQSLPFTNTVIVSPALTKPVANFTATPTEGFAPLSVAFEPSVSQETITSYSWDFGDGSTDSVANPVHVFSQPGEYLVTLVVEGPGGVSDPFTTLVQVREAISVPVASFVVTPTEGTVPLTVQFDSSGSQGIIDSYSWDFGDGSGFSTDPNPAYTYTTLGQFTVSLTVSGPGGSSFSFTTLVQVREAISAPVASFVVTPTEGTTPLTVQFDSSASQGIIDSHAWDFGDGSGFSTDPNPAYTYTTPGQFTVNLTVSGPGGSNTFSTVVSILEAQPPQNLIEYPVLLTLDIGGQQSLTVRQPDGILVRITDTIGNSRDGIWSPDGSQIAFVSDRDGNAEIYLMNADGSSLLNLTNSGSNDTAPAWSPDGSQIAFVSDRDGNAEIYLMNADGSSLLNLTNSGSNDTAPAWSPDGSQIAFVSDRSGTWKVYLMRANGTDILTLTTESIIPTRIAINSR